MRGPLGTMTGQNGRRPTRIAVPHHRGKALRLNPALDAPNPTDPEAIADWIQGDGSPTAIDLFAGAGGLSLGLKDAGFRVLVGADADPLAVESHTANVGGLGYAGDLTDPSEFIETLHGWGIQYVDLVAGGPPCQAFSRAGRSRLRELVANGQRSGQDPRASMWRSFMAVVKALRPKAVLMENVPDLAGWDDGAVLIDFLESLRILGYRVEARILDGWRHGVPQHRSRLFLVGFLHHHDFSWPSENVHTPTLRDAIGDLPAVAPGQRRERVRYWAKTGAISALATRLRQDVPDDERDLVYDHVTRAVRDDDAEAFALLPEGGTYSDLPSDLQRYRTDIFSDKYKRLEWNRVSRSITAHLAKDGYWYIHPEQNRTLSIREAARIQTFPDWFRFAGEPTHRYRQIGNAVPPLLGEALGQAILSTLLQAPRPTSSPRRDAGFRRRLLKWHESNRRVYPWRKGVSPWHVLMAEMCLQRTRADQVAPVYTRLVEIAPTPDLMLSRTDEVIDAMSSLGLAWRARKLIECAQAIVDSHGGLVPDNDLELRSLPGVGDYASQAVLCFGFGRRSVLIDTNTARIVERVHGRTGRRRWQTRLDLYALAGHEGPDAEFNYALLDLGALVCRARSPHCEICPVLAMCSKGSDPDARQSEAVELASA